MKYRPRQGRTLFLAYICCAYVLILVAAPLVSALEPSSMGRSSAGGGAPRVWTFEQLDRNKSGFIEISEAAAVPGLSASVERADRNRDGRLDKVEFARALAFIDTGR